MVNTQPLSESAWSDARWMVLAPHADDETLGTGALIATTAKAGQLAGVIFLTDGGASHPHVDDLSRMRLTDIRRQEAKDALGVLCGGQTPQILFLNWPDANSDSVEGLNGHRDAERLADFCAEHRVTALAVTALHEPHCDHAAAARLGRAVVALTGPSVSLFEYLVWADGPPKRARKAVVTDPVQPVVRTAALTMHRSQLTDLFGPGFRLEPAKLNMAERDILYLWEGTDAA